MNPITSPYLPFVAKQQNDEKSGGIRYRAGDHDEKYQAYKIYKSKAYDLNIKGQVETIPDQYVCTGLFQVPADSIETKKILNLTGFFFQSYNLWSNEYASDAKTKTNVFERVGNFMVKHAREIFQHGFTHFLPAINPNRPKGKNDVPNVNMAFCYWMLKHTDAPLLFVDPLSYLQDTRLSKKSVYIDVINLRVVAEYIQDKLAYDFPKDIDGTGANSTSIINYQRNGGHPNGQEYKELMYHIDDDRARFVNVCLSLGKYGHGRKVQKDLYKQFIQNVSQMVHQFSDMNQYLALSRRSAIHRIHLVPDEFSGTSMFTIAALVGYGLDDITEMLCYYNGNYTSFRLIELASSRFDMQ